MTRIAIMRPEEKMEDSAALARKYGFEPVCASPLEVRIVDSEGFDSFLNRLKSGTLDAIILTSAIGARALLDLAEKRMKREELLALVSRTEVLSIGPQTSKSLESIGFHVHFMPRTYSSEGILRSISDGWAEGKRVAVIRSDQGDQKLIEGLVAEGAKVIEVVVYSLVPVTDSPEMRALLSETLAGRIDVFAFTSPLSARTFLDALGHAASKDKVQKVMGDAIVAAIGKPTRKALEAEGIGVDVIPPEATFDRLLAAVDEFLKKAEEGH